MRAILLLLVVGFPTAAFAQANVVTPRFGAAPWWMDQPILASSGFFRTDFPANRADFTATFQSVDKSSAKATGMSAEKVRALGAQLRAFGAEKARIETTFTMTPIYDQYRDRAGDLIDNERADKIERYEVNAEISVEVLDMTVLEEVYATVLAARPTDTGEVSFRLLPTNANTTELFQQAVSDARRRAEVSVNAVGASLGPIRLLDPSGRACVTDVLLAAPPKVAEESMMSSMDRKRRAVTATDEVAGAARLRPEDMRVPLQPPLIALSATACVVYGISD